MIIWDEANKTEHFIRQANIQTKSPDIGFLVPTPDTPELAVADQNIFEMTDSIGQPEKIAPTNYRSPWTLVSPVVTSSLLHLDRLNPTALLSGIQGLTFARGKPNVLAEHDIAGYHATTLAADDEQTLATWLSTNGYLSTPELRAWLKQYSAAKWKITAFKLIKNDEMSASVITRAIRLSFRTDRPFYPYSEPSDRQRTNAASPEGRALSVSILSNERMTGMLADHKSWPEKLEFAGPSISTPSVTVKNSLTPQQWLAAANLNAPHENVSVPTKLTTFIDESNPRPGTADLYFTPDRDQSSYQGQAIDFTIPAQNKFVFNFSFADFVALLVIIILPAAPIYCGWRVLNQQPEKKISPFFKVSPPKPQSPEADRFIGFLAIGIGAFYGTQFILLLLGEIISAMLGWSNIHGYWIWTFLGLLLATIFVVAMSWGVIFCGMNVSRTSLREVTVGQGFMGALSLAAGSVAFLTITSILFAML